MGNQHSNPNKGGSASRNRTEILESRRRYFAALNPRRGLEEDVYTDDPTSSPISIRNPLCDAVALCDEIAVSALLTHNVSDVNGRSEHGDTPLHLATRRGHIRLIELLLQHGALINAVEIPSGYTALHHAVLCDLRQARMLYDAHFPPTDNVAASVGSIASSNDVLIRLLLDHKANAAACAANGLTPLHAALQSQRVSDAVLLMKRFEYRVRCGSLTTTQGESVIHLLARLSVVNLLDAALKHNYYCHKRTKNATEHDAFLSAFRRVTDEIHQNTPGKLWRAQQLIDESDRRDNMDAALTLPCSPELSPWTVGVDIVSGASPLCERVLLSHLFMNRMPANRTERTRNSNPLVSGVVFAAPITKRNTLSLQDMLTSSSFRTQGTLDEASANLWTAGRIFDNEKWFIGELIAGVRKSADATLRAQTATTKSNGQGLSLTFDNLMSFFDAYDSLPMVQPQEEPPVSTTPTPQSVTPLRTSRTEIGTSLRRKMNLLCGDPLDAAEASAFPRTSSFTVNIKRCVEAMNTTTSVVSVLDAVAVDGTLQKSPLAYCNDAGGTFKTAAKERHCVLMLMSLRAQLLCEETMGFVPSKGEVPVPAV